MDEKWLERIAIFDLLSPQEQDEVRRFLDAHPQWREEFERYRRLYRLLRAEFPEETGEPVSIPIPPIQRFTNPIPRIHPRGRVRFLHRTSSWAAAAVLLLGLYGGLWWYGEKTRAPWVRLAEVPKGLVSPVQVVLRDSAPQPSDSLHRVLARAIEELQRAPRSYAGLFPHFDPERVQRAIALLERIQRLRGLETWEGVEARYFLAKAYLMQGNLPRARALLEELVDREHMRTGEVRRLLEGMRTLSSED
jgi:hypothetical protein|nr:MAG: hypothetical protein KatS3mg041_0420 [Bacteroidota bacterium]